MSGGRRPEKAASKLPPDGSGPTGLAARGWHLRADQNPGSPHQAMDSAWAIAGGTAVFLGSLLPFVSFSDPEIGVNPGARAATALFGLIVLGLGVALRAVQHRFLMGTSLAILCLSALGVLGYAITIVAGMAGITEQDPFGYSREGHVLPRHRDPPRTRWLRGRRRRGHQVPSALQVLIMRRYRDLAACEIYLRQ